MDKTDRLRDYGLAFLLYEQGLGICGYELIRELFIFIKLILNSYLKKYCRFCGSVHIFPIEVYKRIPKEMTRVHIFYADGSNRTIDTGSVSIQ